MTYRYRVACGVALLVVACAGCKSERNSPPDVQRLTDHAVNAAGEQEARAAVDQLREATFERVGVEIRHDRPVRTLPMDAEASEALRRVLVESLHSAARAHAAKTLGEMMDVDAAEPLLDTMQDDDAVEVRREAYEAMRLILGLRFADLGPEDPPELRAEAVQKNRQMLENMKKHPMIEVIRDPRKRAAYDKQVIQRYRNLMQQQEGTDPASYKRYMADPKAEAPPRNVLEQDPSSYDQDVQQERLRTNKRP